ncbi:unnamed protein product [Brassica rapa]|uniref:Uncharacterized protein n=1 Tax=Brassica campestris TaxID=3711 RepID=A0A8D9H265_BRACM|nr:unnamed protein product [Brassica rapa]
MGGGGGVPKIAGFHPLMGGGGGLFQPAPGGPGGLPANLSGWMANQSVVPHPSAAPSGPMGLACKVTEITEPSQCCSMRLADNRGLCTHMVMQPSLIKICVVKI